MRIEVVVTRHPALVEYLRELGLVEREVMTLTHASSQDVADKHVAGVLPHSLSCLAASFTEVPLRLTPDMRGKELDLETIRRIAEPPVTYRVIKLK
jgi:hypothetical protein